jgi:hypothetical protein
MGKLKHDSCRELYMKKVYLKVVHGNMYTLHLACIPRQLLPPLLSLKSQIALQVEASEQASSVSVSLNSHMEPQDISLDQIFLAFEELDPQHQAYL